MPQYDYRCPDNHTLSKMRRMSARHDPLPCPECGKETTLVMSLPHCPPDGVYSYAPNTGDKNTFDRRWENLKAGKKLSDGSG